MKISQIKIKCKQNITIFCCRTIISYITNTIVFDFYFDKTFLNNICFSLSSSSVKATIIWLFEEIIGIQFVLDKSEHVLYIIIVRPTSLTCFEPLW